MRIEWVNADGQRVGDASATTGTDGRLEIPAPPDAKGAYLQARFVANGKEMEYLSLPPAIDEGSADKPLLLDTANTIVTARVRESRRRGEAIARPAKAVLKRLRELLKPETVPFMGVDSEDVADTFDQMVNDDASLNEEVVKANKALQQPARAWQVQDWHTQASLRASGAVPADMKFNVATTSRFEVDQAGNMYIILGKGPASLYKVTPAGVSTKLADLPEISRRPYTIARTPDGTMMVGCTTATGEVLLLQYDRQTLTELARQPFEQKDDESALTFQRMAARDDGTIYLTHRTGNSIWVRRSGSTTLARLAGDPAPGYRDGPGLEARFHGPRAVTLGRDGALYVADGENMSIRRIDASGNVSTVAGQPNESEARFGRGQFARLGKPGGVVATDDGTVFATDVTGNRVIRISPNGSVFLVAGTGQPGLANGSGKEASFRFPANLAFDKQGNLYLQDTNRISDTEAEIVLRRIVNPKATSQQVENGTPKPAN